MPDYGERVTDFSTGDRVELHPSVDWWMQGARYGTVLQPYTNHFTTTVKVKLDKLRRPKYIMPNLLKKVT